MAEGGARLARQQCEERGGQAHDVKLRLVVTQRFVLVSLPWVLRWRK